MPKRGLKQVKSSSYSKNLKEILTEVKPIYSRILRKAQTPIFHELLVASKSLPENYQQRFELLIQDAENKLNERPVLIPFSSYEFKYKLCKIKDDIATSKNEALTKNLKRRLSKLTNGVAVIHVGASSTVELGEKKDRIDDALCATRAAIE